MCSFIKGDVIQRIHPVTKARWCHCDSSGHSATTNADVHHVAIVGDGSATTSVTCFSDEANSLTRDCNELLAEIIDKNPYQLPPSLKELEEQSLGWISFEVDLDAALPWTNAGLFGVGNKIVSLRSTEIISEVPHERSSRIILTLSKTITNA
ncbi:hypothetical protein Tco_0648873 [Tanacetum coccineum]